MARAITKLYFAYGMNTNLEEMAYRCPTSEAIGRAVLPGYRFEFKTHATITPDAEQSAEGVLWRITDYDEQMLDILEGFPVYYTKKMVTILHHGIEYIAMTYIMNNNGQPSPPNDMYYATVSEGYQIFGINQKQLLEAKSRANGYKTVDFAL